MAWFAVASLLCGLAPGVPTLIAARMLQGVGAALLTPGSLALLSASFRQPDRARAIGAWSGLGGLAAAAGPLLGGVLVGISWRLVFLINLPICAFVIVVALRHVPESRDEERDPRLDLPGAALGAVGLAGMTYALVTAGSQGASPSVLATAALGLAGLVAFVRTEHRSDHPMVPLEVFADRQFTAANLVTFAIYAALGGVFFLLVIQLQVMGGLSPLTAGTALLPVTACMLLLSPSAGALAPRIGARLPITAGLLICAVALLLMLRIGRGASYPLDVLPAVVVFGLGLSLTVAPLTATATVLAAAEDHFAGVASRVNNAVARTASLLAVAVLPLAAGLHGKDYQDSTAFATGLRIAMVRRVPRHPELRRGHHRRRRGR